MTPKDCILQAGLKLLKERGVAALTQPQVAKAAGLKQSHLTYYFPTRNDLLLGIAEYSVDSILSELSARLNDQPQQQTFAAAIIRNIVEGLPPRVILGLIVAADKDPAIRAALDKLITDVRSTIRLLLKKAELASDSDAALLFHASIVGLAVMHQARQNAESTREIDLGINAIIRKLACSPENGLDD